MLGRGGGRGKPPRPLEEEAPMPTRSTVEVIEGLRVERFNGNNVPGRAPGVAAPVGRKMYRIIRWRRQKYYYDYAKARRHTPSNDLESAVDQGK